MRCAVMHRVVACNAPQHKHCMTWLFVLCWLLFSRGMACSVAFDKWWGVKDVALVVMLRYFFYVTNSVPHHLSHSFTVNTYDTCMQASARERDCLCDDDSFSNFKTFVLTMITRTLSNLACIFILNNIADDDRCTIQHRNAASSDLCLPYISVY